MTTTFKLYFHMFSHPIIDFPHHVFLLVPQFYYLIHRMNLNPFNVHNLNNFVRYSQPNSSNKYFVKSFCLAFRGKDSRFVLEQNLGPYIAGKQETGWLYMQTKELSTQGAVVTCSGDNPFLYRLILAIDSDASNLYPSDLALYMGSEKILPTDVDKNTGLRHDLEAPFRKVVPQNSLVYLKDIRCVMPDVTHMITMCVESDLRKAAQKIVNEKPLYKVALQKLEDNCTRRAMKKPRFQFDLQVKGSDLKKGVVGPVSLSGTLALVAIADKDELGQDIPNLFENVWGKEILFENINNDTDKEVTRAVTNAFAVLRKMHPYLEKFDQVTTNDCANLLQGSLNKCAIILLSSKHGLDVEQFKFWSETYYQSSLLLFSGKEGLTPYKLKMMLVPEIMQAGFVRSPWHHMCEAMEKSNHHAHKDFQTKTMRGGGKLYNPYPLFYEGFFSYCHYLDIVSKHKKNSSERFVYPTSKTIRANYNLF